jgi:hypothetical protein
MDDAVEPAVPRLSGTPVLAMTVGRCRPPERTPAGPLNGVGGRRRNRLRDLPALSAGCETQTRDLRGDGDSVQIEPIRLAIPLTEVDACVGHERDPRGHHIRIARIEPE